MGASIVCAYLLRSIPDGLWVKVRTQATHDGYSLRAVLIRLLIRYVKGDITI